MRVLADTVLEGPRVLTGATFHHLAHVLRVRAGDALTLFDGRGREAEARVVRLWEGELLVQVGEVRQVARPPVALALLVGLLKGEKMDWVVQKATELGVARLVPIATEHGVVKLDAERAAGRRARWVRIAEEAARQCGRADLPEIAEVSRFEDAIAAAVGWRALLHEGARGVALRGLLPAVPPPDVTVAVGPEGGFAPDEVEVARAAGFHVCGLGPRVLRAETCAIAALAVIGFAVGDLG
jgi:16S rRNA (uracil1498-N3)-methyltransferase